MAQKIAQQNAQTNRLNRAKEVYRKAWGSEFCAAKGSGSFSNRRADQEQLTLGKSTRSGVRKRRKGDAPKRRRYKTRREVSLPRPMLAGVAFFFRVKEFGEAWILLEEGEVFVVAGVEAIFAAQVDGYF